MVVGDLVWWRRRMACGVHNGTRLGLGLGSALHLLSPQFCLDAGPRPQKGSSAKRKRGEIPSKNQEVARLVARRQHKTSYTILRQKCRRSTYHIVQLQLNLFLAFDCFLSTHVLHLFVQEMRSLALVRVSQLARKESRFYLWAGVILLFKRENCCELADNIRGKSYCCGYVSLLGCHRNYIFLMTRCFSFHMIQ